MNRNKREYVYKSFRITTVECLVLDRIDMKKKKISFDFNVAIKAEDLEVLVKRKLKKLGLTLIKINSATTEKITYKMSIDDFMAYGKETERIRNEIK